jgi:Mn-dependent DtxR family transcriptional regulator
MTTEQTIERISEILNDSGAHQQLEQLFSFLGLTPLECEELASDIEQKIQEMAMEKWNEKPHEWLRRNDAEERHWEDVATHNERFCD